MYIFNVEITHSGNFYSWWRNSLNLILEAYCTRKRGFSKKSFKQLGYYFFPFLGVLDLNVSRNPLKPHIGVVWPYSFTELKNKNWSPTLLTSHEDSKTAQFNIICQHPATNEMLIQASRSNLNPELKVVWSIFRHKIEK